MTRAEMLELLIRSGVENADAVLVEYDLEVQHQERARCRESVQEFRKELSKRLEEGISSDEKLHVEYCDFTLRILDMWLAAINTSAER